MSKLKSIDNINHPAHYTKGTIECMDYIWDKLDNPIEYIKGNVIKYITRAGLKTDTITDLKKIKWYIDYAIKRLDSELK